MKNDKLKNFSNDIDAAANIASTKTQIIMSDTKEAKIFLIAKRKEIKTIMSEYKIKERQSKYIRLMKKYHPNLDENSIKMFLWRYGVFSEDTLILINFLIALSLFICGMYVLIMHIDIEVATKAAFTPGIAFLSMSIFGILTNIQDRSR